MMAFPRRTFTGEHWGKAMACTVQSVNGDEIAALGTVPLGDLIHWQFFLR